MTGYMHRIQTLAKTLREFADVQVVAPIVTAAALQIL